MDKIKTHFRLAIIGTGPSAYAALKAMRDTGFEDTILLVNGRTAKNENVKDKKFKFKQTSTVTNNFIIEKNISMGKGIILASSNSLGGFSSSWGAVFKPSQKFTDIPSISVNQEWKGSKSESLYKHLLNKTMSKNVISLAIDSSKCIKCGECINGCNYGAIWNAGDSIKSDLNINIINTSKIYKLEYNLINGIQQFYFKDLNNNIYSVDKVIVSAGIISSSLILLNSNPDVLKLKLNHNMMRIGLIYRKGNSLKKENISFAQNYTFLPISHDDFVYSQIYSNLEKVKSQINNRYKLTHGIPNFLWKIITKNLHIIFIYHTTNQSPKIDITSNILPNGPKFKATFLKNQSIFRDTLLTFKIIKTFYSINLILLPFLLRTPHGYSFHLSGDNDNNIPHDLDVLYADGLTFINKTPENFTSKLMDHVYDRVKKWHSSW
jgi:ferredoxin